MKSRPRGKNTIRALSAAIDRIEDGSVAVLLDACACQLNIPAAMLPDGSQAGDWVRLELDDGKVRAIEPDPEETATRRERIHSKMERLRRRSSEGQVGE